jgi:hypothetical protein
MNSILSDILLIIIFLFVSGKAGSVLKICKWNGAD